MTDFVLAIELLCNLQNLVSVLGKKGSIFCRTGLINYLIYSAVSNNFPQNLVLLDLWFSAPYLAVECYKPGCHPWSETGPYCLYCLGSTFLLMLKCTRPLGREQFPSQRCYCCWERASVDCVLQCLNNTPDTSLDTVLFSALVTMVFKYLTSFSAKSFEEL